MSEIQSPSPILLSEDILIDLSSADSFDNILFELTDIVEKSNLQGKNVKINLGRVSLDKASISGLQSLLKSFNMSIKMLFSESILTKIAAIEVGLTVSGDKYEILVEKEPSLHGSDAPMAEDKLIAAMNNMLAGSTDDSEEIEPLETLYIKQTLRSGQKIEHDGNIVIIGDCKAGSEITASGDITIWGILSGIAHAGAKGDYNSIIRAFRINAIQIRIADLLARKPDSTDIERTDRNGFFTPEEAKITSGEIVIYTLNG